MSIPSAAPVTEQGFTYTNNEFLAQTSGGQQHRRASPDELRAHFDSGGGGAERDRPAHWFEAQLLHYGLPPSKVKGTARMRLCDTLNAGTLAVPPNLVALESRLKKKWKRLDKEAKSGSGSKSTARESKRKTEATDSPVEERSRSSATASANITIITNPQSSSFLGGSSSGQPAQPQYHSVRESSAVDPPPRPTALSRRGGLSQRQGRSGSQHVEEENDLPWWHGRAARRGGSYRSERRTTLARSPPPSSYCTPFSDDPPPAYTSYAGDFDDSQSSYTAGRGRQRQDLGPLGLLNGDYDVQSSYVSSQWPDLGTSFSLTLTLVGTELWGRFDLGVYEGVLRMDERPRRASRDEIEFRWRGRETDGPIVFGDNNWGSLRFLGDGYLEGRLDMQSIPFSAVRVSGQETRSSISAADLRSEWNEYSGNEYERQRRARWR